MADTRDDEWFYALGDSIACGRHLAAAIRNGDVRPFRPAEQDEAERGCEYCDGRFTREVLVHLNVKVSADLSTPSAEADAVERAMAAARHSDEAFQDLIALVDVQ